jgi:hypothetical protein
LKLQALESVNTNNGAFYLIEKKKKEMEGRMRDLGAG